MNDELTAIDLFSGLGGFAVAAHANGIRTECFVEKDADCREFLSKAWPGVKIYEDIKDFDGRQFAGADFLFGGPPCQPASRAGEQRGSGDDRWLWNHAVRVVSEAKPTWFILENPPGIQDLGEFGISPPMDCIGSGEGNIGDVFTRSGRGSLDKILESLESLGYEVQTFDIPACAVNSPQLRHRLWIVGHASGEQRQIHERTRRLEVADARRPACGVGLADTASPGREGPDAERGPNGCGSKCSQGELADAQCERRERRPSESSQTQGGQSQPATPGLRSAWDDFVWIDCADRKLRRAPRDFVSMDHGLPGELPFPLAQAHRSILKAIGNSIVPAVASELIRVIIETERQSQ